MERASHAKVEMDAEVFGLFRDLVPAMAMEQGGELETVRAKNGKVPDLSITSQFRPILRPRGLQVDS